MLNKLIKMISSKKAKITHNLVVNSNVEIIEIENKLFISFTEKISKQDVIELLNELWDKKYALSFHDTIINKNSSDPGAYFSYSTEQTIGKNIWSMTYGNHGWSGGIYHLRAETVSQQIYNLLFKKELERIQITGVGFFSHYEIQYFMHLFTLPRPTFCQVE